MEKTADNKEREFEGAPERLRNCLFGAMGGDIAGSTYEFRRNRIKQYDRVELYQPDSRFTDDTVCTVAVAEALLTGNSFAGCLQRWCDRYRDVGYGHSFRAWIDNPVPYNSYGNGSGMRVSPIGFWAPDEDEVLRLARQSAECSHNHPEGVKGAQAVALAVWRALRGGDKAPVRAVLTEYYPDYAARCLDDIRPGYHFDSSCQGSVPVALLAFLESRDYEDCLKLSISMGGDADTIAAMAGSVAYAFYRQMPDRLTGIIQRLLPREMLDICERFDRECKFPL